VAGFLLVAGCCGDSRTTSAWSGVEYTVRPSSEAPVRTGWLRVDTPLDEVCERDTRRIEEMAERSYMPCQIYDEQGKFIREVGSYCNEDAPRIPIDAGKYIVETQVRGETRRVQVVVATGRVTRVSLEDFVATVR
jgi:hypothetical protein